MNQRTSNGKLYVYECDSQTESSFYFRVLLEFVLIFFASFTKSRGRRDDLVAKTRREAAAAVGQAASQTDRQRNAANRELRLDSWSDEESLL